MKIKLLVPIASPEGTYKINSIVELSDKLTTALIRDGHAVIVEEEEKEEIKAVEVVEEEVVETKVFEPKKTVKKAVKKAVKKTNKK